MGPGANVSSIEALNEFRAALIEFIEDARDAVSANDMEIQRAFAWLDDQVKHWQKEERIRQEEMVTAKRNLKQRQLMETPSRKPDTTEQEEALTLAKRRLREAEQKLASSRHWKNLLRREADQYFGPAHILASMLDANLPKAAVVLEHKIATLEAYVGIAPAPTDGGAPAEPAPASAETESAPPDSAKP